jgi:hypothetical protein
LPEPVAMIDDGLVTVESVEIVACRSIEEEDQA